MTKITIQAAEVTAMAELNQSHTAKKILKSLPVSGKANTWGDEIYFEIPVQINQEPTARTDVEVGELGYWQPGQAFCIFFGKTPASTGTKPRAASPVNVFGKIIGSTTVFRTVKDGQTVRVERAA